MQFTENTATTNKRQQRLIDALRHLGRENTKKVTPTRLLAQGPNRRTKNLCDQRCSLFGFQAQAPRLTKTEARPRRPTTTSSSSRRLRISWGVRHERHIPFDQIARRITGPGTETARRMVPERPRCRPRVQGREHRRRSRRIIVASTSIPENGPTSRLGSAAPT